jgi:hypothetical protein
MRAISCFLIFLGIMRTSGMTSRLSDWKSTSREKLQILQSLHRLWMFCEPRSALMSWTFPDSLTIQRMYHEKISSTLNFGVSASAMTGEKMLRKGVDIGNQISQNIGIFLPIPIDNYIKIVCSIKEAARYSDDFYMLARTKEELHEAMAGVRREAAQLGLIINEKKTHICKLGGQYRHLQMLYTLHPDGEITCKINPKAITRERRKLKAYKRLMDAGRMEYREIENNFKSWICAHYKFMSKQQIQNMSRLFKGLFGKDTTWKKKKGHGRLRWLMGQKSRA